MQNTEFEVGDNVKVVRDHYLLKYDHIYTIESVSAGYIHLMGVDGGWYRSRFELVEEQKQVVEKFQFNPGDVVKCIDNSEVEDIVNVSQLYVVLRVDNGEENYDMLSLEKVTNFYGRLLSTRFELVSRNLIPQQIANQIDKAKSLIDKTVQYKDSACVEVAIEWELIVDKKYSGSLTVMNKLQSNGYCVAVRYGCYFSPVEDLEEVSSKKFVLNENHTATVFKNKIQVGCQTFPSDVILEMADYIKSIR